MSCAHILALTFESWYTQSKCFSNYAGISSRPILSEPGLLPAPSQQGDRIAFVGSLGWYLIERDRRHLIDHLVSGSVTERWRAVRRLARCDEDDVRQALVAALCDASAIVRWRAALALGRRHDSQTLATLRAAMGRVSDHQDSVWDALSRVARSPTVLDLDQPLQAGDARLRQAAIETLGRFRLAERVPTLLAIIEDGNEAVAVRHAALRALAEMPASQDVERVLARAMHDPCSLIRAEAARAVGCFRLIPLADRVCALLQDHDVYVRYAAALSLIQVGQMTHVAPLKQAMGRETVQAAMRLRPVVRKALWTIRWRGFVQSLRRILVALWPTKEREADGQTGAER